MEENLYLPDSPNTPRRVLRGVRAKMALILSQNNQNIFLKIVMIIFEQFKHDTPTPCWEAKVNGDPLPPHY